MRVGNVHRGRGLRRVLTGLVFASLLAVATQAGVVADLSVGTAAPPVVLGGYAMTPFPPDGRPILDFVLGVPAPGGGAVGFSPDLQHRRVPTTWSTWSHGYMGDVYYGGSGVLSATLTLPADTYAFYFYAEPVSFGVFTITATSNSGASLVQPVDGSAGARFFGFYGTHGDTLATITVSIEAAANGFAVGEFGIARAPICEGLGFDSSVGTDAPPAMLGDYPMTPFPADTRPLLEDVFDVSAPGGGFLEFCPDVSHRRIGDGWATWSHGYQGDVYFREGNQLTMTLPGGTFAFYFYAEPNSFGEYSITAVADDGSSVSQLVEGSFGARYYGFYSCNDGTTIKKIIIRAAPEANGFAVGEFGIAREPLCLGIGVDLTPGTGAPPATLGGYEVIPFMPDTRPTLDDVDFVYTPLGGILDFSIPLNHRRIGDGWSTWSHDYTGDVYYTAGDTEVTVILPPDTYAFYLYAEPNPFSAIEFIARANDGTEVAEVVEGASGAQYFGFYSCRGTVSLSSITIMATTDFSIGEFGIALRDRGECGLLSETLPGTDAPPDVLGGYDMIPFGPDDRPLGMTVAGVPAPGGSGVAFDPDLTHLRIGQGWATWSHGYLGDVYRNFEDVAVLTMPPDTFAFYFYAEPESFGSYLIAAQANDGTLIIQNVEGASGARYYGFYACSCRSTIETITIAAQEEANGFAVGEFGIARTPRELRPGDMNCDGLLNAFDIDPFVVALTDPAAYEAAYPCCFRNLADINLDGLLNAFDIDPFVVVLTGG